MLEEVLRKKRKIVERLAEERKELKKLAKEIRKILLEKGYLRKVTGKKVKTAGVDSAFALIRYTNTAVFYCTTVCYDGNYTGRSAVEVVEEVVDSFASSLAAAFELSVAKNAVEKVDLIILDGSVHFFVVSVKIGEERTIKDAFPVKGKKYEDLWEEAKEFLLEIPMCGPPFGAKVVFVPKSTGKKDLFQWFSEILPEKTGRILAERAGLISDAGLADLILLPGEYITGVKPVPTEISTLYGVSSLDPAWQQLLNYRCTFLKGVNGRVFKVEHHGEFNPGTLWRETISIPVLPIFHAEKAARRILAEAVKVETPVEEEVR